MKIVELNNTHGANYLCEADGCDQAADYEFSDYDADADCMTHNWLCEVHAEPLLNPDPRQGEPI